MKPHSIVKSCVVMFISSLISTFGNKVPTQLVDMDKSVYVLKPPDYITTKIIPKKQVIYSDYNVCHHPQPIRYTFGSEQVDSQSHSVPMEWSSYLSVMSHIFTIPLYDLAVKGAVKELLVPFTFMVMIAAIAILAIIPYLIVGCLLWAILFNLRIFGHKKVRMAIRSLLIRFEKYRRWKYERSFHTQHLRKFRERDRYQMPKVFQNSDLSSDDEPLELTREQIGRQTTTMWDQEEQKMLGFDPDNIPMEIVYGDLLENLRELDPEVRKYVNELSKRKHIRKQHRSAGSASSEEMIEKLQMEYQMSKEAEEEKAKAHGFLESIKNIFTSDGDDKKHDEFTGDRTSAIASQLEAIENELESSRKEGKKRNPRVKGKRQKPIKGKPDLTPKKPNPPHYVVPKTLKPAQNKTTPSIPRKPNPNDKSPAPPPKNPVVKKQNPSPPNKWTS